MRKVFLSALLLGIISCSRSEEDITKVSQEMIKVSFKEDNSVISNPERGFYIRRDFRKPSELISNTEIKNKIKAEKHSLVFIDFRLEDFVNKSTISNEMIQMMQKNFDIVRENGIKVLIRFAYSSTSEEGAGVIFDADEDIVLKHIAQLKPLLERNKDVIAVIEAGFIGGYGEWYYSTYYGNKDQANHDKRKRILKAILDTFPKDRMVSVRTPAIKTIFLGINAENGALSQGEAFTQSYKARLGHHNDCFLANEDDEGTYKNSAERTYTQIDSKYTVMGGETCTPPNGYSECNKAIQTMRDYHWSYLNMSYHGSMISDWRKSGCFTKIQNNLGYRFVLKEVQYSKKILAGQDYEMSLSFENKGFASPYNPRVAYIKFRSVEDSKMYLTHKIEYNPQFWFTGSHNVKIKMKLPNNLPNGKYDVLLHLPDVSPSIANRPEYAIRFANVNTWEDKTGYNKLYTQTKD